MQMQNILQDIEFTSADKTISSRQSRAIKKGQLRRIAPRILTSNFDDPVEAIIKRNIWLIIAHQFPQAMVSHRSALEYSPTAEGDLFLTAKHSRNLVLPGITLRMTSGPSPLDNDREQMGVRFSSEPRAFLENMQSSRQRKGAKKALEQQAIEKLLEARLATHGEEALNELRDYARKVADQLGMEVEFEKLNRIISAMLSTGPAKDLVSEVGLGRARKYDGARITMFQTLFSALKSTMFAERTEQNVHYQAWTNFSFFEAYFSNYIEGTVFTVEEATEIVNSGTPIATRSEDSHDVLGTFSIVSNRKEMSILPATPDELFQLLQRRHYAMMQFRPQIEPGEFKSKANRAGEYVFVAPELVMGTLAQGFEMYQALTSPFARAAYIMFMISEVHPFNDGNGRIARIMMNAELVAAAQSKIIIPTVYRQDYLRSLKRLSRKSEPNLFIRMLSYAHEFSHQLVGEDRQQMDEQLQNSNAFREEDEGIRLLLPS